MNNVSKKSDELIKKYVFQSGVTGFIPIPFMDALGLMGVQQLMLYDLSKLYNVPYSKASAKTWITGLTSGLTSQAVRPMMGSALKLIPGIGTLAGGASMALLGGASTYAIGKVFQQHFEDGGTLENFDIEIGKETFEAEYQKETGG